MNPFALVVLATPVLLAACARNDPPLDPRTETAVDVCLELGDCPSRPIDVRQTTFAQDVLGNRLPVLVVFSAEWSGVAWTIAPDLERIAAEQRGSLVVAKVDVEENPALAKEYEVTSIPTLLLFESGQEQGRLLGALPKSTIESFVAGTLSAPALSQ